MGIITNVILPLALALIMFAMGLGLTGRDFARVFAQPRDFVAGAALQLIALPVAAFVLASVWPMAAILAVGLMILASCPGGTTSNLMTLIARGDVALSISLTAVISLLAVVTVPLIVGSSLTHFMGQAAPPLPVLETVLQITAIVVVPTALGMLVRRLAPAFAQRAGDYTRPLSAAVFVFVVIAALISSREDIVPFFTVAGPVCLVFNLLMLGIAHSVAAGLRLDRPQRIAVTIECGFQNATLGIVVGTTLLGDVRFAIPSAVYGLIMLFTGLGYSLLVARRQGA